VLLKNGNIQVNDGPIFGSAKFTSPIIFDKKSETTTLISSKNVLYFTNEDGIVEFDLLNKLQASFIDINLFLIVLFNIIV
jgi:hypothetical protein